MLSNLARVGDPGKITKQVPNHTRGVRLFFALLSPSTRGVRLFFAFLSPSTRGVRLFFAFLSPSTRGVRLLNAFLSPSTRGVRLFFAFLSPSTRGVSSLCEPPTEPALYQVLMSPFRASYLITSLPPPTIIDHIPAKKYVNAFPERPTTTTELQI